MSVGFTLRQLSYFVRAAETGSTAAAAQSFYLNQSSMSAALTELESALGAQLFIRRRGKGLELTATGRALLAEARQLVRAGEEFQDLAANLHEGLSGRLVVGCFDTIAPAVLPPLLRAFGERHAAVELDFLEAGQVELQDALRAGTIELSIMYDHDLASGIDAVTLTEPTPHVLVRHDHPVAALERVHLAEVVDEPFIMITTAPAHPLILQVFESVGLAPDIRYRSRNFDHIRALVHAGLGITMISQLEGTTPGHWGSELVAVPVAGDVPHRRVVLAARREVKLTRRAHALRAMCIELLGDGRPRG